MPAHRGPRLLPKQVTLATKPTISPGVVYAALGISRQCAGLWRARYGLPNADARTGYIDTSALAAWLAERGCRVRWI